MLRAIFLEQQIFHEGFALIFGHSIPLQPALGGLAA
jgi:hypothetical protein